MTDGSVGRVRPARAPDRGVVNSHGSDVAWERWPRPGALPIALVHGTSAHSGWWHFCVPFLESGYDVAAIDLTGHGDSGHRDSYEMEDWADDVLAVIREVWGRPAIVVGHSVGGLVAALAASCAPESVAALVLVDSVVREVRRDNVDFRRPRGTSVYASAEDAVKAFRLTPPQPTHDPVVLSYVAERSLKPVPGGWGWKVDSRIFDVVAKAGLTRGLAGITCPVVVVRGERSVLVGPDAAEVLSQLTGRPVPQYDIPGAYHHVLLDEWRVFGETLRRAVDVLAQETRAGAVGPLLPAAEVRAVEAGARTNGKCAY